MDRRLTAPQYETLKKTYFSGWKTWNVNSVLSYVHMPDALALKLSLREYRSGHYLADSLIGQFPDTTGLSPKEVLYPGDHALDDRDLYVSIVPEKDVMRRTVISSITGERSCP